MHKMPRQTYCRNGHPREGNIRIRSDGYCHCKTCEEESRKAYRPLHRERDRLLQRIRKAKKRKKGAYRSGYTKNVLQIVGRDRLTQAFAAARETGAICSTFTVLGDGKWYAGTSRWDALQFFYPKIRQPMAKIIQAQKNGDESADYQTRKTCAGPSRER
jgi:hypothetical protein